MIRRTGQHYALRSEASLRFEKGQESRLARLGADRTAQLILEWAGGRAAKGAIDTDPADPPALRLVFRPERIVRLLGVEVAAGEMRALLNRVGIETAPATAADVVVIAIGARPIPLDAAGAHTALVAIVPGHRRDLAIEADIAEEVARIRGYETLPGRRPDTLMPTYRPDPHAATDRIRDLLSGRGLSEVVTFSLIAPGDHARLGDGRDDPATIRATNPVTVEHSELRRSLIPELSRVLVDNERQRRDDVAIFETGITHRWTDGQPVERHQLGILLAGLASPPTWDAPSRPVDVADAKGLIEWLVGRVAVGRVRYEPATVRAGVEHPGRTAVVAVEQASGTPVELGRVGELDPRYLAAVGARAERAIYAVIDLDGLARLAPTGRRITVLERLPGVDRDIAVVIDRSRPAGEVEDLIHAAGGAHLRSVSLFDRYQGPQIGEHEVSLTYRLRFEPGERPLEEKEIDTTISAITQALSDRLGARLRA